MVKTDDAPLPTSTPPTPSTTRRTSSGSEANTKSSARQASKNLVKVQKELEALKKKNQRLTNELEYTKEQLNKAEQELSVSKFSPNQPSTTTEATTSGGGDGDLLAGLAGLAELRARPNNLKRSIATQYDPPRIKKVVKKRPLPTKPRSDGRDPWQPEEDAALLRGVNEHGLDFGRIKGQDDANPLGPILSRRTARALGDHFRYVSPSRFKAMKALGQSVRF